MIRKSIPTPKHLRQLRRFSAAVEDTGWSWKWKAAGAVAAATITPFLGVKLLQFDWETREAVEYVAPVIVEYIRQKYGFEDEDSEARVAMLAQMEIAKEPVVVQVSSGASVTMHGTATIADIESVLGENTSLHAISFADSPPGSTTTDQENVDKACDDASKEFGVASLRLRANIRNSLWDSDEITQTASSASSSGITIGPSSWACNSISTLSDGKSESERHIEELKAKIVALEEEYSSGSSFRSMDEISEDIKRNRTHLRTYTAKNSRRWFGFLS